MSPVRVCYFPEHDPVAYAGATCPCCAIRDLLLSRIELLKSQLERMNKELLHINAEV